jgi:hypothetical protein
MSSLVHTYGDALLDEGRLRACDARLRISSGKGRMSEMGHSGTQGGHALMSEKGPEADIELRCLNVAEVP